MNCNDNLTECDGILSIWISENYEHLNHEEYCHLHPESSSFYMPMELHELISWWSKNYPFKCQYIPICRTFEGESFLANQLNLFALPIYLTMWHFYHTDWSKQIEPHSGACYRATNNMWDYWIEIDSSKIEYTDVDDNWD